MSNTLLTTSVTDCATKRYLLKPGIEQVHALAGISRSAPCCHSNEIRACTDCEFTQ